ncbi:MAG: hypothetical protein GY842_16175 [bacterium]|nr:hypothetical protein [bacterium]
MSTPTAHRTNAQAGFIALGALAIIVYAVASPATFGTATKQHPFLMGFLKLFLLGTFGELLKFRLTQGTWGLDKVWQRAGVWGLFGLWFTLAFPGFSALVDALEGAGLWPATVVILPDSIWTAFSKSLWINLLGMFAWGMMVTHEYCNYLIRNAWRSWSLRGFAEQTDPGFVLSFIPKTLLFWIPAHTFTFAMPPEWRVFIAALLAVVLGFLLSAGRRPRTGADQRD